MNNISLESKDVVQWINKIHCGDALNILKQMPNNIIDCVVTSPPYY
jgi:DNA modification methylase